MTDIIYERGQARETIIWAPFEYNGPFNTVHEAERVVIFGLYANTYLLGHNYLTEIETVDLARLVDNYTVAIARITNDEAKLALDVAAKRYLERIEGQIHEENLITRGKKIDALDDEYDARDAALDADREALITKQAEVQLAWDRADQKIKDLEMRVELEDAAQQLVDVDITEQELRAARADLAVIEAGLKGLDIQLSITQAGIDLTNTDLQIVNAEAEVDEIGIRVSETEVQESGVDLDITNAGIAKTRAEVDGQKIQRDTKEVAVRASEIEVRTTETEAREDELAAQTAGIEADTAKLGLIDSEHTIAQADKRAFQAENALLVQDKLLIDSQGEHVTAETIVVDAQTETREELDAKQIEHEDTKSNAEIGMSQRQTDADDSIKDIQVGTFDSKKNMIDDEKDLRVEDADAKSRIPKVKGQHAVDWTNAAVRAAQDMADADIINTLTHSIGQA